MVSPLDGVDRPLYRPARAALRRVLSPLAKARGFRVHGAAHLPTGPERLIIACNHASFADTAYLAIALRTPFVVCGAKPRLFRTPAQRALMRLVNVLRVDDHDQYLSDVTSLLWRGHLVVAYPEMGRNADGMGRFETWVAEVALATSTPVLPVYLHGTTRGHEPPVRLHVGERLTPTGDATAFTARIRDAIEALCCS